MFTVFRQHRFGKGFDSISEATEAVQAMRLEDLSACQYTIVREPGAGTMDFAVRRKHAISSKHLDYVAATDRIKLRRGIDSQTCIYTIEFSE